MARSRTVGVMVGLSLGCLVACGGGEPPPGDAATPQPDESAASAAATASPSTVSTPQMPPAPEPPEAANTVAGRRAFARHVVDAWGYALRSNDPDPIRRLSPRRKLCGGCRQLQTEPRQREKQGWYVDFPGAEVKSTKVRAVGTSSTARMTVAIPRSDSYNDDGSFRSTNPARASTRFAVEMRYTSKGFELLGFKVG